MDAAFSLLSSASRMLFFRRKTISISFVQPEREKIFHAKDGSFRKWKARDNLYILYTRLSQLGENIGIDAIISDYCYAKIKVYFSPNILEIFLFSGSPVSSLH